MKAFAIMVMAVFVFCMPVSAEYIVTWTVDNSYIISCPEPDLGPDEFGRIPQTNAMTLQICWETNIDHMHRTFATLKEAEAFVKRAKDSMPDNPRWFVFPDLQNFKIQEMLLEGNK